GVGGRRIDKARKAALEVEDERGAHDASPIESAGPVGAAQGKLAIGARLIEDAVVSTQLLAVILAVADEDVMAVVDVLVDLGDQVVKLVARSAIAAGDEIVRG